MPDITLSQQEYEDLVTLAKRTLNTPELRAFESSMAVIERRNGIEVSILALRWTEAGSPNPPHYTFPQSWPPEQEAVMRKVGGPITREEVEAELEARAKVPVTVLVSPDPGAELGWTTLDDFFKAGP
jgi:hypothetical protein